MMLIAQLCHQEVGRNTGKGGNEDGIQGNGSGAGDGGGMEQGEAQRPAAVPGGAAEALLWGASSQHAQPSLYYPVPHFLDRSSWQGFQLHYRNVYLRLPQTVLHLTSHLIHPLLRKWQSYGLPTDSTLWGWRGMICHCHGMPCLVFFKDPLFQNVKLYFL